MDPNLGSQLFHFKLLSPPQPLGLHPGTVPAPTLGLPGLDRFWPVEESTLYDCTPHNDERDV